MTVVTISKNKPDYALAQEEAYNLLVQSEQTVLPINLKKLCKQFDNLTVYSYTQFSKKRGLSFNETVHFAQSKYGCMWYCKNDDHYVLLFNDLETHEQRKRYTIAHELGHYILKHNEKSNRTLLSRYSMADDEYDTFEKEANYFAKRLLAPIPLVDRFINKWKRISASQIEKIFNVSYTVSGYILDGLQKRFECANIIEEKHILQKQFDNFIHEQTNTVSCNTCKHESHGINVIFCAICGSSDVSKIKWDMYLTYHKFKGASIMQRISSIEIDTESRVLICPKCANIDISHNYCCVCGVYIINRCSGYNASEDITKTELRDQHNADSNCNEILPGYARFCPKCGSQSTFYRNELLTHWSTANEKLPF
ncbi:hypothetical protein BN2127_JRS10_02165 [Bacillus subtilis]|nr:hypothetical protein BN2127_JRS10_02165 [Bacillus subtilis]